MEGSLARPADPGPATKRQATADAEVKAALDAKLHEVRAAPARSWSAAPR